MKIVNTTFLLGRNTTFLFGAYINNSTSLCREIDEAHAQGRAIDLLVIRAHGTVDGISLDRFERLTIHDRLPTTSCFHNLSSHATVLIASCSTGSGGWGTYNLANHIARNCPKDVRVFSATRPASHFAITREDPIEFEFSCPPLDTSNPLEVYSYRPNDYFRTTYRIDDMNRDRVFDLPEPSPPLIHSAPSEEEVPDLYFGAGRSPASEASMDELLNQIGQQLAQCAGQVSGVLPAIDELRQLHEIMTVLVRNPEEGPSTIVSKLLRIPKEMITNVLHKPKEFLSLGNRLLEEESAGSCMGALAVCGSLLTFMKSATWIADFLKDPKAMVLETVKMPYTCLKGVLDLGIAFIRHPGRTALKFCKSLVTAPIKIVKRFLKIFKKKKKKKQQISHVRQQISPQQQARLFKKYATDLATLYGAAKENWFIDPFKTIEEYHFDLFEDWKSSVMAKTLCKNFLDFPLILKKKFDDRDLCGIRELSPRAHPQEAMAPLDVVFAFVEVEQAMAKLEIASQMLGAADRADTASNLALEIQKSRLEQNTVQLGALLINNEERLRQALLAKIQARNNQ